jgi:septal ring factor EnvC (AmiA/AmiB activator)
LPWSYKSSPKQGLALAAAVAASLTLAAPAPARQVAPQSAAALRAAAADLSVQAAQDGLDIAAQRQRLSQLAQREQVLTRDLAAARGRLARLLGALQLYRRDPPPALLVRSSDARDAVRAAILIRAMTPALQERAAALSGRTREIAALRRQAAAASEDLFTAESRAAERRNRIVGALMEAAELAPPQGDSLPRLQVPARAALARRFGETLGAGGRSDGVFLRTAARAPVVAPANASVVFAGPVKGWGLVLILRVNGAYHLVLAGLEQVSASPGQSVAAGTTVGNMPDGGKSALDLYIEVRQNGVPVDPARWMTLPPQVTAARRDG